MRTLGYIAAAILAAFFVSAIILGLFGHSAYESGQIIARAAPYVLIGGLIILGLWVVVNVVRRAIEVICKD